MRHLLEIDDLTKDELFEVIALALDPNPPQVLSRKGMALVFMKPSARTCWKPLTHPGVTIPRRRVRRFIVSPWTTTEKMTTT